MKEGQGFTPHSLESQRADASRRWNIMSNSMKYDVI